MSDSIGIAKREDARPLSRVPSNLPTIGGRESDTLCRRPDLTAVVHSLLDNAKLALASDREAATASVALAFELLRDGATPGTTITSPSHVRGGLVRWQLRRVVARIDARLAHTISQEELARIVGLSKSHFSRAFKISVGQTVHSYIIRRRIEHARDLILTTDEPLSQIALTCGMSDQSHLSRLFKRIVGLSPSIWRREWRCGDSSSTSSYR
jgi:AraC family transcriptional regulator